LVTPLTTGRGVWVIGEVSHLRDERVQVPPQPPAGWVPSSFLVRRRSPTGRRIGLSLDKRVVAGSSPASGSRRRGSSAVEHVPPSSPLIRRFPSAGRRAWVIVRNTNRTPVHQLVRRSTRPRPCACIGMSSCRTRRPLWWP